MIDYRGNVDFLDETLCANGRSSSSATRSGSTCGKRVPTSSKSSDLPPLTELDGVIFAFITRRHTIMPFAQELTPSKACSPTCGANHPQLCFPAGQGRRVGEDGGDRSVHHRVARGESEPVPRHRDGPGREVPRQGQVLAVQHGGMGEIIEESEQDGVKKKKKIVRKSTRVPIDLMAAIQRGDLQGTNVYELG